MRQPVDIQLTGARLAGNAVQTPRRCCGFRDSLRQTDNRRSVDGETAISKPGQRDQRLPPRAPWAPRRSGCAAGGACLQGPWRSCPRTDLFLFLFLFSVDLSAISRPPRSSRRAASTAAAGVGRITRAAQGGRLWVVSRRTHYQVRLPASLRGLPPPGALLRLDAGAQGAVRRVLGLLFMPCWQAFSSVCSD